MIDCGQSEYLMCCGVSQTWQSGVSGAQEAHRTDPVVHRDDDDAAPVGHLLPVVQRVSEDRHVVGRPQQEGSSEQIHHHREVCGHCRGDRESLVFKEPVKNLQIKSHFIYTAPY